MDQQQLRSRLQGCYVTIPTLFDDDSLEVNFAGIAQHVEFLIAGGLQEGTGLILSGGGAGDFSTMSIAERIEVARTVVEAAAVVADKQLESRGYFRQVEHPEAGPLRVPGPPYRHSLTPWRLGGPAPRVGQHNDEVLPEALAPVPARAGTDSRPTGDPRPLAGIRVVEFSVGMAGPWIGRFMAYCGAEVIRVESHKRPDVVRQYVPPRAPEMGTQPQLSPWFTDWDAGKRFVALDLTKADAVGLAKRLVARADVVVENYRAGVVEKLGLGYRQLVSVCPDLIMLSTSGYGDSGPCAGYATWGPNIEALSGLSSLSGFFHRQATVTQYAYPDGASAMHGLFAVMCALDYRRSGGQGQYINLSQLETMVAAIGPALMGPLAGGPEPVRLGNASPVAAPYGCYPCRGEDRWCVVCVDDEDEWLSLCGVMQRPELAHDRRFATMALRLENSAALDVEIQAWTRSLDAYDVMQRLQKVSVAAGVVQNVEDLMERDRQLAARNFFEQVEHLSPVGEAEHVAHFRLARRTGAMGNRLIQQRKTIAHRAIGGARDQADCGEFDFHLFLLGDHLKMGGQGFHIDAAKIEALAARQHGDRQLAHFRGGENEFCVRRRLLQRLQKGIEGLLGEHMHFIDNIDPVARAGRAVAHAVDQFAHVIDAGIRRRIHLDQVSMAALGNRLADRAVIGGACLRKNRLQEIWMRSEKASPRSKSLILTARFRWR